MLSMLLLTALAAQAVPAAAPTTATPTTPAEMRRLMLGTWVKDPAPFKVGDATVYVRETTIITSNVESLRVEAFFDAALTKPLLTYASSGPYLLRGPSKTVAGAFDIDLQNTTSTLTV